MVWIIVAGVAATGTGPEEAGLDVLGAFVLLAALMPPPPPPPEAGTDSVELAPLLVFGALVLGADIVMSKNLFKLFIFGVIVHTKTNNIIVLWLCKGK